MAQTVEEIREEARGYIDEALYSLQGTIQSIPDNDDILELWYIANNIESHLEELKEGLSMYENAVKEGV